MPILYSVLLGIDVLLAIGMIALILLQHGKGADAGAAFGSGASATVFGARGSASFLSRSTAILAAVFFVNSLALAYLASNQPGPQSVVDRIQRETADVPATLPAVPEDVPGGVPAEPRPGPSESAPGGVPADVPQ